MKRRILSAIITTALTLSALSLSACQSEKSLETTDLMTGIKAASHETVKPDDAFKSAYDNFSVELLKKCFDSKSNTLISPLSVSSALTMTANGANGQTKDEMEKVLGSGMPLDELNKYLSSFSGSLTSGEDFKLKTQIRYGSEMKKTGLPLKRTFCRKMRIISVRQYTSVHLTTQRAKRSTIG